MSVVYFEKNILGGESNGGSVQSWRLSEVKLLWSVRSKRADWYSGISKLCSGGPLCAPPPPAHFCHPFRQIYSQSPPRS